MGNILNHNRLPFDCTLSMTDYWDFHLYLPEGGGYPSNSTLHEECLAAYIDTTVDECFIYSGLRSKSGYSYSECVSNGLELKNIGFTGTDNGLFTFDKYKITDEEFAEMLKSSVYRVCADDCTLRVFEVGGNNRLYNYSNQMVLVDGMRCSRLNGGFYQGFFMDTSGCQYKVLPHTLGQAGWSLEFELKRHDFDNNHRTLNDVYPQNKGIFFYIGTRAENKWIKYYKTECEFENNTLEEDYHTDYMDTPDCEEEFQPCLYSEYFPNHYIADIDCGCQVFFKGDYIEPSAKKENKIETTETNDGHLLSEANLTEIETDNKFVLFDRSCDGETVHTYEEGDTAVIQYKNIKDDRNYFTLFNRSCDGMTVFDYDEYIAENSNDYNIYDDLYNNAFALQVKDDGSVGYKYFVKDCEAENPKCSYKIESEFTNPDEVRYDEWCNIHVRIVPQKNPALMRVMIYVNGLLKLVSKELPTLNLRKLDELPDKQEGVPFNISLGGGTQGLCDVIYNDYQQLPEKIYPLEKEFGGSFIGFFKSFKFYECNLNYTYLNENLPHIRTL